MSEKKTTPKTTHGLTKAQLDNLKKILEQQKHDLLEKSHRAVDSFAKDRYQFPDAVDNASQEGDFSTEVRTLSRERNLMLKIDEALARIDIGEYGHCELCGTDIDVRRLEARPTATQCIECKTVEEMRERVS
jgi:DnaK suppressor protein